MNYLVLLVVALVVTYRVMKPEERARAMRALSRMKQWLIQAITLRHPELESFHDMLHARTPVALVTPALFAVNITIFVLMLWGSHPLSDPNTLVEWGGNVGPRTANGEWWRIFTALFVHASWLHLLANVVGLLQLGLMLERLVGPLAFAAVYLAAGLFSNVIQLSAAPATMSIGASGAIFGAYGLMLAVSTWGVLHRSSSIVPMTAAKSLAPAAAMFVLYSLATDNVWSVAELSGCITGFACGLVVTQHVREEKASTRRVATATAALVAVTVVAAAALRGLDEFVDVRPELKRLVEVEERTTSTFRAAADQFTSGRITADALAELIDGGIMPDVTAARARFESLDNVAVEQHTLVAAGNEYLRLRDESWRVRSAALRQGSMPMLSKADTVERASLEILHQVTEP
jgi:membrane associated rhomboid family serine protease